MRPDTNSRDVSAEKAPPYPQPIQNIEKIERPPLGSDNDCAWRASMEPKND